MVNIRKSTYSFACHNVHVHDLVARVRVLVRTVRHETVVVICKAQCVHSAHTALKYKFTFKKRKATDQIQTRVTQSVKTSTLKPFYLSVQAV